MPFNLKSKNPGVLITITAGAAITSGELVEVGANLAGVAQADAASGEQVEVDIGPAVYTVNATATEDVAIGVLMYYDVSADDKVTDSAATGDFICGTTVAAQDGTNDVVDLAIGHIASAASA